MSLRGNKEVFLRNDFWITNQIKCKGPAVELKGERCF